MNRTLLISVCCLLTACAAGPQQTLVQQAPQIPEIKVSPTVNLTRPPQTLPQPQSGEMRDLEANHRLVAEAFHKMAAQLCSLLQHLEIEHHECLSYLRPEQP